MPLIKIDLIEGRSDAELAEISNAVHRGLVECFGVPQRDQFQIVTEHRAGRLIYNESYLDIQRTDSIVVVQVFLSSGRSDDQKKAFYALVTKLIAERANTRPEDVIITLVENTRSDWSFGNGVAQYLTLPKEQWK
jgi:phenylpyruvate tautomerase PptA (4-oxalocrotonate tautomerase family)